MLFQVTESKMEIVSHQWINKMNLEYVTEHCFQIIISITLPIFNRKRTNLASKIWNEYKSWKLNMAGQSCQYYHNMNTVIHTEQIVLHPHNHCLSALSNIPGYKWGRFHIFKFAVARIEVLGIDSHTRMWKWQLVSHPFHVLISS